MQISSRLALNPLILHSLSFTRTAQDGGRAAGTLLFFCSPNSHRISNSAGDNISLAADFLQKQPAAVGWANQLFMVASQSLYAVYAKTQGAPG